MFGLSIGLSLTTIGALRSAKSLAGICIRPVSGFFFKFVNYRVLNNIAILVWSGLVWSGLVWLVGCLFLFHHAAWPGTFAGPIAGGLLASTMGIPAMFRIVPIGLTGAYLIAVFLVIQTEKRTVDRAFVKEN